MQNLKELVILNSSERVEMSGPGPDKMYTIVHVEHENGVTAFIINKVKTADRTAADAVFKSWSSNKI